VKRLLAAGLANLLLLLALLLAALGIVAGTELGTRWLWRFAQPLVPGELAAEQVGGTLLGGLRLEGVHYRGAGLELTLGRLALDWRPWTLTQRRLHVTRLALEDLDLRLPPPAPDAPPAGAPVLADLGLPLDLRVDQARLERAVIHREAQSWPLDRIELAAGFEGGRLRLERLELDAPELAVRSSGSLSTTAEWPLELALEWRLRLPEQPELAGAGTLSGPLLTPALDHRLTAPFVLTTSGRLALGGEAPAAELSGRWEGLRWPLAGEPATVASASGGYRFSGGAAQWSASLEAALAGAQIPPGQWSAEARGDSSGLRLEALRGGILDGELTATGELAWSPGLSWRVELAGSGLDPGTRWPEWPGRLALAGSSEGRLGAGGVETQIRLERLDGTLRGYPLEAKVAAGLAGESVSLERATLRSGETRIEAAGGLDREWALTWRVASANLAELLPQLGGALQASGTLRGPRTAPRVQASVHGEALALEGMRVASLDGSVDLDPLDQAPSRLDLAAGGLALDDKTIGNLRLAGEGRTTAHRLRLDLSGGEPTLALAASGGWNGKAWEGRLERLDLAQQQAGAWVLERPAALSLGPASARGDGLCLASAPARLCGEGRWAGPSGWSASGRLEQLPLERLGPWLPEGVAVEGTAGGEVQAAGLGPAVKADLRLAVPETVVRYRDPDGRPAAVTLTGLDLSGALEGSRAEARLQAALAGGGGIESRLTLARGAAGWGEARLGGEAQLELPDLELIAAFAPGLERPRGQVRANLAFAGTVAAPRLQGEAALTGFQAAIPPLGIRVSEGELRARGDEQGVIALTGRARSGPGAVSLDGRVVLDAQQGWPLRLQVRGKDFAAVNLPEARALIDPALTLDLQGQRLQVSGEVAVPEARITLRELPTSAVAVSDDVVVVDAESPPAERSPLALFADLTVRLGEKVTFSGFGLGARLGGSLRVREAPGQAPRGEGELRILEGRYKAYGQDLTIDRGRLIFAGPIDNPALDLRATRSVGDIVAGLQATGTAQASRVTLFSTPPMEDAEVLSYLLLGRPLNQASGSDGQMLMGAVGALGVSGGNLLAKQIGNTLGLDDVRVESESGLESTSLVLGRYLSPKLYVSYGVGLFEPGTSVQMRYDLSRRFKLRAESGTQSGMDILYSIEK